MFSARALAVMGLMASAVVFTGCDRRSSREHVTSRMAMKGLLLAVLSYQDQHKQWPDKQDDVKSIVGAGTFEKVMKNPITGDKPGYEFVKPAEENPASSTIVLYQLRGGKRDASLDVGRADGATGPASP